MSQISMQTASHRPRRPAAGFTLIELLTVVAIIATMMSVLMPAVFKAMEEVQKQRDREIVSRLTAASKMYMHDWEGMAPGVVSNPTNTGLTPGKISGCQNLRLALVGSEKSGGQLIPRYQGSGDLEGYVQSDKRIYLKRHEGQEFVPHKELAWTAADGTNGEIELFADTQFKPARPILYYRKRAGSFHFSDNAVYCTQDGETSERLQAVIDQSADRANVQFIMIWAGLDRKFFTDDDYVIYSH